MEDSNARHYANQQEEKFIYFCPLPLDIEVTEGNTTHQDWMEQCFTYREKRQGKIGFSGGCRSPKASGSLQATHAGQFTYTS